MERIEPGRLILAVLVFVACAAPRPAAPRAPVESWSARPADAAPLGRVAEPGPRLIARDTVFVSDVRPDSIEITVDVAEGVTPATVSFREGPTDRDDAFCAPGIPAGTPTPTSRWCPRVVEDVRVWVRVEARRPLGWVISPAAGRTVSLATADGAVPEPVEPTLPPGAGGRSTMTLRGDPDLPRALPVLPDGYERAIRVGAGGDLQTAIDGAREGTEILLEPGTVFEGPFRLPDRGDDGWVRIATDIEAPAARIDTASELAASLATITADVDFGTLIAREGGGGWHLDLLHITYDGDRTNALVYVDARDGQRTDRFLVERSWLHRRSEAHWITRCIIANGGNFTVRRSALTGCTRPGQQTQGIVQWDTPGPTLIEDNLIMAGSQGYMCGGAGGVADHPSDITIRRNYIYTPASWQGVYHNLAPIETKDCKRVLIEGTVIDGGQFGLLLKSSSQNGSCGEGCGTEHVTIRNSIIRNTRGGVNTNRSEGAGAVEMHDILFDNVLFEDIGPSSKGWRDGEGRMFQILGATSGLTIRNVTYDTDGHSYLFPVNARQPKGRDFTYDNVVVNGTFRYRMLVQQPRAFQGHYETYEFGTAYGNCGNAPVPLTCFRSIPPEAGADMERIRAATAGVVP